MAITITRGKTKIDVVTRGCTQCGTEHSGGWYTYETIEAVIGTRRLQIYISICMDCAPKVSARNKN